MFKTIENTYLGTIFITDQAIYILILKCCSFIGQSKLSCAYICLENFQSICIFPLIPSFTFFLSASVFDAKSLFCHFKSVLASIEKCDLATPIDCFLSLIEFAFDCLSQCDGNNKVCLPVTRHRHNIRHKIWQRHTEKVSAFHN